MSNEVIETQEGPVPLAELQVRHGLIDDHARFGLYREYLRGDRVVRRDEGEYWRKTNDYMGLDGKIRREGFTSDVLREDGCLLTERPGAGGEVVREYRHPDTMAVSFSTSDTPTAFHFVVECRDADGTVVHRSAGAKLKATLLQQPLPTTGTAGSFGG